MAKRPTINTLTNTASPTYLTQLNQNFSNVQAQFDNTLSLDGSLPNAMNADLDLNDFDLINAGTVNADNLVVAGTNLNSVVAQAATSATNAAASASSAAASAATASQYTPAYFTDVAALLADTRAWPTGQILNTREEGFAYEVVTSGPHVATAGGVKLIVLPGDAGYNVKAFGAKGDGTTNDTAAIQLGADYLATVADSVVVNGLAAKNHPTMYFPSSDGYRITSTISIGKNISVICDGPILVDASASATPSGSAWVVIGEETVTTNRAGRNCEYVLDVRRVTLSNWSSASDVGVTLLTAGSKLWIRRIDSFAIGVKLTAPYSVTTLGEFRDCGIGLDVTPTALDFTNQQLFLGGEFAVVNGSNNGVARYGVRLTKGALSKQNSITFIAPSFELNKTAAGAADCFAFIVDDFWNVRVKDMRTEGSGTAVARLTNDTRWFQADLIYDVESTLPVAGLLDDQSTYKIGNRAWHSGGDFDPFKANLVFDSGPLIDETTYFGFSGYHVKNMEVAVNTDPATFVLYGGVSSLDYKNRQVTLGSVPLGVRVDTRLANQFCVVVEGPDTKNINLYILVFDSNGNQLVANTDVLQNAATPTVASNTGVYGGLYNLSTALDGERQFATITFSANVVTAFIGVSGGIVRAMKIYSLNGPSSYFSKSTQLGKNQRLARQAPVGGYYPRGTQIWNSETAAAGSPGWVVTTGGQFVTLSGVTANTTNGSRSVTFNDASALFIGAVVTIAGVSGNKIIEALEGNVGFVDSNCDATVTGGAVASVSPVFKTMAVVSA